jgi:ABC-type sugar transport system substrate-binding protein
MLALVGLLWVLTSCGRQSRPLVLMFPGESDAAYWKVAHVGGIKAALDLDADVALAPDGAGRRAAGFVIGRGARVPGDSFAVALQTPAEGTGARTEVVADYYGGGEMAARFAADLVGSEGEVALLATDANDPATQARFKGITDTFTQTFLLRKMRVVRTDSVGGDPVKVKTAVLQMIQSTPGLRIIYADSEFVALGVIEALKARANTKVRTIAFAKSDAVIQEMRMRIIDGLLVEDAVGAGYLAVAAVVRSRRGENVEAQISVPMQLITRFDMERQTMIDLLRPDFEGWAGRLKLRR